MALAAPPPVNELTAVSAASEWTKKQRRTLATARTLAPPILVTMGRTWRWNLPRGVPPGAFVEKPEPAIYVFWHRCLLPIAWLARRRGFGVLVSHHFDGELVSQVAERLGYRLFRGSSTRGGRTALDEMTTALEQGQPLALTVDGPRGPRFQAKPGAIALARATGAPIYALHAAPMEAWTTRSWDRFQIPKPLTTIFGVWSGPMHVPADTAPDAMEAWRQRMEQALNDLRAEADQATGVKGDLQ